MTAYVTNATLTVQALDDGYLVQVAARDQPGHKVIPAPRTIACRTLEEVLEAVRTSLEALA